MIFTYLSDYFQQVNKTHLILCTVYAALLVAGNYYWGWEKQLIYQLPGRVQRFAAFYLVYAAAFCVPFLLLYWLGPGKLIWPAELIWAIVLLPAVFALKTSVGGWQPLIEAQWPGTAGQRMNVLVNWPIRLVITLLTLFIGFYLMTLRDPSLSGFSVSVGLITRGVNWWPYIIMLAAAVPLVVFASSQPDFLATYPKLKMLGSGAAVPAWQKFLFELCYGSDFFTIELFFRGFLVVFLSRWLGAAVILPMAVFYCSIHFGKPLLECISSYFGGILLGIFACYSQSIFGGIIVHLGLAWMMELAATWRLANFTE